MKARLHVLVVGAGAFGGWIALFLSRRGVRVTLIDSWGAGNARSSSGGESRIIRGTYGPNQPYTRMAARALSLWLEHEKRWRIRLLHRTGVLWMVTAHDDQFERGSLPLLREAGVAYEELSVKQISARWPQINLDDVRWGIYEPDGGFLRARVACQAVVDAFEGEGGEYRIGSVVPEASETYGSGVRLSDGTQLVADRCVFACGPWLGQLFPQTIGSRVRPTKQDVLFFGPPAGDSRFSEPNLPVWAEHGDRFIYGMPAGDGRGFKVADDTRGAQLDPTSGERMVSAESLKVARDYLGLRFPGMKHAPVIESRVCQYENTPDNHLIIDRHPAAENVWMVGGGSGHGFKHGPALGEMVADWVIGDTNPNAVFQLSRFRP